VSIPLFQTPKTDVVDGDRPRDRPRESVAGGGGLKKTDRPRPGTCDRPGRRESDRPRGLASMGGLHSAPQGLGEPDTGKQRFALTIMADDQPDDPFGIRRLRMALKILRRRFGLRCLSAETIEERKPNADGEYSYPFPVNED
jgi:hypothetical protein